MNWQSKSVPGRVIQGSLHAPRATLRARKSRGFMPGSGIKAVMCMNAALLVAGLAPARDEQGSLQVRIGKTEEPRILFVGNSYSFKVPGLLARLVRELRLLRRWSSNQGFPQRGAFHPRRIQGRRQRTFGRRTSRTS